MAGHKQAIANALDKAKPLKGLGKAEIFSLIEIPPNSEMGDYSFPCFKVASKLKKAPAEIALGVVNEIKPPMGFREIKVMGPYINFFIEEHAFAKQAIEKVLKEKNNYGKNNAGKKEKLMIEYSAPNTNKPLHIGHLRNDSIGMSVSKILENANYKVTKADLLNDRGIHICKSMLAYKKWGKGKNPKSGKIKADHFVGKYYKLYNENAKKNPGLDKEAQEMLVQWEQGKKDVIALWKKMNNWATAGFKETYNLFGSEFDVYFHESDFYNKARPIIEAGLKNGVLVKDESGAVMADLEKYNMPKKTVLRADGTSIYLTNDLALTKHKFDKYKIRQSIWVVGSEQNTYFRQLFKIFELLGYKWAKDCRHLSYGMVFLPEGRLKSREGRVIDADDLIGEVKSLAEKELKKRYKLGAKELETRSRQIALAAIKFYMLKVDAVKSLHFDAKQAISFEGDTGPYLQYTYARAKSILRKAGKVNKYDASLLDSAEEKGLVKTISNYPAIAEKSAKSLQPSIVCNYLLELCAAFNLFYHSQPVLKAEAGVRNARLKLVEASAITIRNALGLLNIEAIERM